jgi:hypothetical protein
MATHNREGKSISLLSPQVSNNPFSMFTSSQERERGGGGGGSGQQVQGGCLMALGKKKVRRSFSTVFKFAWSVAPSSSSSASTSSTSVEQALGDSVLRLCFVLSNDARGNSTAAAANASSSTSTSTPDSAHQANASLVTSKNSYLNAYSLDGINKLNENSKSFYDGVTHVANSFAVILEINKEGAKLLMVKSGDVNNANIEPEIICETKTFRRPLAEDKGHWLLVEVIIIIIIIIVVLLLLLFYCFRFSHLITQCIPNLPYHNMTKQTVRSS